MKKIHGVSITDKAVKDIERCFECQIEDMSHEELHELIKEIKGGIYDDNNGIITFNVDGNKEFVWTDDDIELVCYVEDIRGFEGDRNFYEVKNLGVYMSEDKYDGEYYPQGDIGDSDCFIDFFLGEGEKFNKNVRNLVWIDDENILYKSLKDILAEIDDNDEDNNYIELFVTNKLDCDLEGALRSDDDYKDIEFEEMGCFAGKKAYKIGERLYFISDDSYSFNTEHHYYLQEVSHRCYEEFGLKKPDA